MYLWKKGSQSFPVLFLQNIADVVSKKSHQVSVSLGSFLQILRPSNRSWRQQSINLCLNSHRKALISQTAWFSPTFSYPYIYTMWIKQRRPMDKGCLCKAGWFFLRWITADHSPWANFIPLVKQQCGETLGDLEPVYHLFTSDSITLSQAVTHVAYTRKSTVRRNEPYEMWKRTKPLTRRARLKKA